MLVEVLSAMDVTSSENPNGVLGSTISEKLLPPFFLHQPRLHKRGMGCEKDILPLTCPY